jgi:hypothetical protein
VDAGYGATTANYSNSYWCRSGSAQQVHHFQTFMDIKLVRIIGSVGNNNIIIGTNISLSSGNTNSINIGGVLFGKNTYQFSGGTTVSLDKQQVEYI